MEKTFEVTRINSIPKNSHGINFQNGRGEAGLGFFSSIEGAKAKIKSHKIERPAEKWPYVVIHYLDGENGRIVYVEYMETCLIESKLKE